MAASNLEIVIDGDGHIFEDTNGIRRFLPSPLKESVTASVLGIFPHLDHLHHTMNETPPGSFGKTPQGTFKDPGPDGWMDFLNRAGIESTVLYPTSGLAYGRIMDVDYAIAVARAYNDWLCHTYARRDPRLRGMALIPMQEPEAAVAELRRAIRELGMCGAMLPSTGLKAHLGAKEYWPVYAEAERLGCALAVHGGAHQDLGLNTMNIFAATHALGHPVGIMIGLAGMVFNGIFDRFPGLRVAFLEGGVAWFLMALERFTGSYAAFIPNDPRKEYLQLEKGETVADYVIRHAKAGRIYVGVEGDEPALAYAVKVAGPEAFVYSSDFPHEVNLTSVRGEIEELLENEELTAPEKEAILSKNAERLYKLTPVHA
jgi:hypothetical protein